MPDDVPDAKKRKRPSSSPESKTATEVDRLKKRRNRTTQSCLNCHSSKRMCDRKRPACSRCTQLGLMGLCVYEVDDPSRSVASEEDEPSRLLRRVAELEGVVRELKNKQPPKWSQTSSEKQSNALIPPLKVRKADRLEVLSDSDSPCSSLHTEASSGCSSSVGMTSSSPSYFTLPSPLDNSTPSTSEYGNIQADLSDIYANSEWDLSTLLQYSDILSGDPSLMNICKHDEDRCSCVDEQEAYIAVLELSLKLRIVRDKLQRSPHHQLWTFCSLERMVSDLDTFITRALGCIHTTAGPGNTSRRYPTPMRISDMVFPLLRDETGIDDPLMNWVPPSCR